MNTATQIVQTEIPKRLARAIRQAATAKQLADPVELVRSTHKLAMAADSLQSATRLISTFDVGSDGCYDDMFAEASKRIAEAATMIAGQMATN